MAKLPGLAPEFDISKIERHEFADSQKELTVSAYYGWKLAGQGSASADDDGEPNAVISSWEIVLADEDEKEIGKLAFSVVNQGEAYNRGDELFEVYDSEDSFHFDYYEHIADRPGLEELMTSSRAILLSEVDLSDFQPVQQLDVLQILSQIFSDVVIAVCCEDRNSEAVAHLAAALAELPRLPSDEPKERWLYHDSKYRWMIGANGPPVSSR